MSNIQRRRRTIEDKEANDVRQVKNRMNDVSNGNPCPFFPSAMIQSLPQNFMEEIISMLPLSQLLMALGDFDMLSAIIWASPQFQNAWDERNLERCLFVNHYDDVSVYNINNGQWCENILSQWINSLSGSLRAAAGGLLVFLNKKQGTLEALNPLTMQVHHIPDLAINLKFRLSYYMKRHPEDIVIEVTDYLNTKSYQIIVMGNFTYGGLHILIYRFTKKSWEIKIPENSISLKQFPRILIDKERIICFSQDLLSVASYSSTGENRITVKHILTGRWNTEGLNNRVVVFKGRIILFELESTNAYVIFELLGKLLDETGTARPGTARPVPFWKRRYMYGGGLFPSEPPFPSENFVVTCAGGDKDCIWILFDSGGMMSLDVDADMALMGTAASNNKPIILACPSRNNLTCHNSKIFCMPLKFLSCLGD